MRPAPADLPGGIVRTLDVDQIRPGPYQPRQGVASSELEALAASLREHGVLQPVIVRPVGPAYELVAGERRWRAARLAGMPAIPAVVRELSDQEAAVMSLVENVQREGLHFFDEAEGYRRLVEEFGMTQSGVASVLGRTDSAVSHKLRILELDEGVRRLVVEGGLSERHARALLRLADSDERAAAAHAFVAGSMTVRQAEAWVARRVQDPATRRQRAEAPAGIVRSAERWAARWRRSGYEVTLQASAGDGFELHIRMVPAAQAPSDRGLG